MRVVSFTGFIRQIIFLSIIIFTGILSACNEDKEEGADLMIGDRIPALNLELSDNSRIDEVRLSGKVTVILLFTTECPDYRRQLPVMEAFHREYEKNKDIVIFGISRNNPEPDVKEYWENNHLTFPYSAQPDKKIYNLFARSTVPRIYISDCTGIIRAKFQDNPLATKQGLKEITDELLREI